MNDVMNVGFFLSFFFFYLLQVPASHVSKDLNIYCSLWKLLGWNL